MKKCPNCGREYETTNTLCPVDGTVLERSTTDELIGQTLAGKYRIEEYINAGGMASVYRATHVLMDKRVAVKILHPALAADDTLVARFTREAKAASRISHPHALNVTDFGEADNGIVFLVMEYLGGQTLKELIHAESPLALIRISEITRQACGALDAAHAEGVVHRDLKSDNIMLGDVGTFHDWVKVLDFGIAKIQEPLGLDSSLTAPNIVIGTPQYMSPEQCAQSAAIDFHSDIYSYGIILYEMLTGHTPFTGDSATSIMMKHLQEPAPSVLIERPDLPVAVGLVIDRALAKQPEDRFASAGEMAEAFTAAVMESPEVAAQGVVVVESVETKQIESATTVTALDEPGAGEVVMTQANVAATPTDSNNPARTTAQHGDEDETVVHERVNAEPGVVVMATPAEKVAAAYANVAAHEQVANSSTRRIPWRFIVPAVALVAAVSVYAMSNLSSNENPTAPSQTQPLRVDPESQPVTPTAATTTGDGERNLSVRPVTSNTNLAATGSSTTVRTGANTNTSGDPLAVDEPPTNEEGDTTDAPPVNVNRNVNRNANTDAAVEEEEQPDEEQPTPTPAAPANRNANTRRTAPTLPDIAPTNPTPPPPPRRTPRTEASPPSNTGNTDATPPGAAAELPSVKP